MVTFQVKFTKGDMQEPEIRHFTIDEEAATYAALKEKIENLFTDVQGKDVEIFWIDDEEDEVKLSSDEELLEAVRHTAGGEVLKMVVKLVSEQDGQETCKGCDNEEVIFKCSVCPDFMLCGECAVDGFHCEHQVIRIEINDAECGDHHLHLPRDMMPGPGGRGRMDPRTWMMAGPRGGMICRRGRACPRGVFPRRGRMDSRAGMMGARGRMMGARGMMCPRGRMMHPRGGMMGPRGGMTGPRGGTMGLRGGMMGLRGGMMHPRGGMTGPRGGIMGPRGGTMGLRRGMMGLRGGMMGPRGGRGGPMDPRDERSSPRDDMNGQRDGMSDPREEMMGPMGIQMGPQEEMASDFSRPEVGMGGHGFGCPRLNMVPCI